MSTQTIKRTSCVKTALIGAARASSMTAALFMLAFAYSFMVNEPYARDMFTMGLQQDHYDFVVGFRWYFLAVALALIGMAAYSFGKVVKTK